jgi:hypothetical protein
MSGVEVEQVNTPAAETIAPVVTGVMNVFIRNLPLLLQVHRLARLRKPLPLVLQVHRPDRLKTLLRL